MIEEAILSLTRYRHGQHRLTSKVVANRRHYFGWKSGQAGDFAIISVSSGDDVTESYALELNRTALREIVRVYDEHQSEENKIGRLNNAALAGR
jgi:hypothetical protein